MLRGGVGSEGRMPLGGGVCHQPSLLISSPESGVLSSNPEVTQTAIHPHVEHRQQFGQLAVYQANITVSGDDSLASSVKTGKML